MRVPVVVHIKSKPVMAARGDFGRAKTDASERADGRDTGGERARGRTDGRTKWMNYRIYIPSAISEGRAKVCILRRSLRFRSYLAAGQELLVHLGRSRPINHRLCMRSSVQPPRISSADKMKPMLESFDDSALTWMRVRLCISEERQYFGF